MSSDIKLEALAPKDDLLPEEGTSFGVYYKSLSSAFSNPKIRNIALSGSLGSGKSSIIRSFDRERNGKKRFLYVSLIDFSRAVPGGEGKHYDQQQLEANLLDQILSYCTSDKVPEGSIRGIPEKYKLRNVSAGFLALLCFLVFVLFFHEKFGALAAAIGVPDHISPIVHLVLYLIVALILFGFAFSILRRCLPLLQVTKLLVKSSVAEAEVNLGKKCPSLDTHKFELAYILERIGKKHDYTVVFEDLERLDPATAVAIMSKLRELNALTNNHMQAHGNFQPIRFLYAIADITMPAEYRTKFYDCIIPVIPVSHPLNSQMQLRQILKALRFSAEWEDHLCDALSDAFVDYRTLLSLRNEFQVLQALYDVESKRTNSTVNASDIHNAPFLFAITAYRILLPEWFEWTLSPQGDGILPNLSSGDDRTNFERSDRAKAYRAVRKLFDNGLLDKTSMRLIIGEQALIEQWLKVIRCALDKKEFDEGDEMRIRSITDALQDVFNDVRPDPCMEPYASFRKVVAERLCTLTSMDDKIQFILVANSLAAVSRKETAGDWDWISPESLICPVDFSGFLQNYLCWLDELFGDLKEHPHALSCLKAICKDNPEYLEIVFQHAAKLFNSSDTLGPDTDTFLKILRQTFLQNQEIALEYAKRLVVLSLEQKLPKRTVIIDFLKDLHQAFPNNQEIALEYAKGLFNLSSIQQFPECVETIALLQKLQKTYLDNQEIAVLCAKVLANRSCYQKLSECTETIALLKELRKFYPNSQEIALEYAKGLFNLSSIQKFPEYVETIALLQKLQETYLDNQEIAVLCAKVLAKRSCFQKLSERTETIAHLKELWEFFPNNQEITLEYAKGLFNLSNTQKHLECAETTVLLRNLQQSFPDNHEIALEYAKSLVNLAYEQKLPDRSKTITQLKKLWETFPNHQEIALRYARVLFNTTLYQAEKEIPTTAAELAALLREHPLIIPEFRKNLVVHWHPNRKKLYRPLLELFDGAAAGS